MVNRWLRLSQTTNVVNAQQKQVPLSWPLALPSPWIISHPLQLPGPWMPIAEKRKWEVTPLDKAEC